MGLKKFWNGRKVFISGITGFKGSWLSLTLKNLGAKVYGYSLKEKTKPSNFQILKLKKKLTQLMAMYEIKKNLKLF